MSFWEELTITLWVLAALLGTLELTWWMAARIYST